MPENERLREQRRWAWDYFELHAGQRMSLFNFFVLISALLTAGLASTFKKDCDLQLLAFILGLSLLVISLVFWRLDLRVGSFVKHAEETLKSLEKPWEKEEGNLDENSALFSAEDRKTTKLRADLRKKYRCFQPWICPVTYYECFRLVYIVFAVIGIAGMILSVVGFGN